MQRALRDITNDKEIIDLRSVKKIETRKLKKTAFKEPARSERRLFAAAPAADQFKRRFSSNLLIFTSLAAVIICAFVFFGAVKSGFHLKSSLTAEVSAGYQKLASGAKFILEDRTADALVFFEKAKTDFEKAQKEIWFLSQSDDFAKAQSKIFNSSNAVVGAGIHLSEAARRFTISTKALKPLPALFFSAHKNTDFSLQNPPKKSSITETLKQEIPNINLAFEELNSAVEDLSKIDSLLLPRNLQDKFEFSRNILNSLSSKIGILRKSIPGILALMGDKEPHKILVLMQNNAEKRPTGGFIGSYLLLEMNDGYLTKQEIHDIYHTDYQLKDIIEPPEEIKTITSRWFLRDSNYSPHFAVSGEKAAWFLQKEDGPSVDTVIAIDQTLIESLFEVSGPVFVPSLNNFLTKDNFNLLLSYIVESKFESFGGKEDPKLILKEFIPLFQKALFEKADALAMGSILKKAVKEKHIIAYSRIPEAEEFFKTAEADGSMAELKPADDYLQIVHINIGGNKSDAYMQEKITHDTFLMQDGAVEDELTLEELHAWNSETEKQWQRISSSFGFNEIPEHIKEILGRGKNTTFVRIYVPKGSILVSESPNITVKEDVETGKTYFFLKIETEHGKRTFVKIRYRLPFKLDFDSDPVAQYRLIAQKQMGAQASAMMKRIFPEGRVQNLRFLPNSGALDEEGNLNYQTDLRVDRAFASLWRKR